MHWGCEVCNETLLEAFANVVLCVQSILHGPRQLAPELGDVTELHCLRIWSQLSRLCKSVSEGSWHHFEEKTANIWIHIYIRTHLDFMRRKVGWSLVHWKSKALSFTRTTAPFPHLSPVLDLILRLQMHCLILLVHTKFLHVCTDLYHSSSWLCWTRGRSSDTKSSRSSWGPCLACIVLLHSLSMSCSWGTFNLGFWCCLHIWLLGWYIKW